MLINIDRDSVCAADDVYDHKRQLDYDGNITIRTVFEYLTKISYLPRVAGKAHSWNAIVGNQTIAVILANNNYPEDSNTLSIPIGNLANHDKVSIHFTYNSALY